MNLVYLCKQMVRILHCNITYIDVDGKIKEIYGDMAELGNPFCTDKAFLEETKSRSRKEYPDIFSEKDSIFYAVLWMEEGERLLIGPVCTEKKTRELERYMLKTHGINENIGFRLSFCELKVFGAGVLTLYHLLSEKEMLQSELWEKNEIKEHDLAEVKETVSRVIFQHQERELPHNPYDQEVRELDSIRKGDVEMLRRSLSETYKGEVGQLAKNQVRQAKNIAICVITMASRAAIEGGMIAEEAFSMVDAYIMKIEDMNNVVKIDAMMRQAEYEFAHLVAEIHKNKEKNELVERAKNYIFQNLHNEIIIGNIGQEIGINTNYLSGLFHQTEGITIQQYIRREKIKLAENMLRYSEYDVKEIANYLAFCSQSYFGNVFKKETGMSPAKYRRKYGQWKELK